MAMPSTDEGRMPAGRSERDDPTVQAIVAARRFHEHLAQLCVLLAHDPAAAARAERLLAEVVTRLRRPSGADGALSPPHAEPAPAAPPHPTSRGGRYRFRHEGDYWTLAAEGTLVRLRGLRGFAYIAELLRHPHEPIYVLDLVTLAATAAPPPLDSAQIAEHGLRVSAGADDAPLLDRRARADYRARWRELLAEESQARCDNDPGRLGRAQRELEMLTAELTAVGTGCGRDGPSLKERARVNVRNCITAGLRAIRVRHDVLWRHLSNSIKTGTFCCYVPDRPVEWEL